MELLLKEGIKKNVFCRVLRFIDSQNIIYLSNNKTNADLILLL